MIRPRLVVLLAVQNVLGQRRRSALLAALMALVAAIAIVGGTLVEDIEGGMRLTIVESLAGERQVVPRTSSERLSLFGDIYFGDVTLERIADAGALAERLRPLAAVDEAVPMALRLAAFTQPSTIDAAVARLRRALEQGDAEAARAAERHLRWAAESLSARLDELAPDALAPGERERRRDVLARVRSDALWHQLDVTREATLMFLDASFAPLFGEATPLFLHVTGVDTAAFVRAFPRFGVVRGRMIEPDEPAFMVSENTFKAVRHQYLTKLDALAEWAAYGEELPAARVAALRDAAPALVDQLTPEQAEALRERLCQQLSCASGATAVEALERYADVDRANVAERARYLDEVAMAGLPRGLLVLGRHYSVAMADDDGRPRTVRLALAGTYRFAGLEEVPIEVAALMSASRFARVDDPRWRPREEAAAAQAAPFDPAAMDELFLSDDAPPPPTVTTGAFDELAGFEAPGNDDEPPFVLAAWPAQSIALRLSAAADARALLELDAVVAAASGDLVVVDGFQVAGPVGHAVPILKGVFVGVLMLLLLLAFGVVANALVLSWLRRIPELGTLRALGATRGDVWATLLAEALLLGVAGALGGAALGGAALFALGTSGIPAPSAVFEFIFGGPSLHPRLDGDTLLLGGVVVLLALVASVYPAWRAARATPREAMGGGR